GAAAGALLGVGIQLALPGVMADLLPVDVTIRVAPGPILVGLGVGVWVALVFALRPLVALRNVSPLQALRRESDASVMRTTRWAPGPLLITLATIASVVAIATSRSDSLTEGVMLAGGVGTAVLVLWGSAALLVSQARRLSRPAWSYTLRQGVANLYRPGNQTRVVALALGFGVFLMSTLYQVQDNLLRTLNVRLEASRANVVFFDVQQDQRDGIDSLIRAAGHELVQQAPIVPMRIASINGEEVVGAQGDVGGRRRAGWALRREYRSTYRSEPQPSERITAGRWFQEPDGDDVYEASFEQGLAEELGVGLGDSVTWNVQGVRVKTVITSLREVNWARFETNFFVVTEPGALERAPQQFVLLAHAATPESIALLQRDVVREFPSVSSIDLTLVQQTVGNVLSKVVVAIRFLAVLSLALGIPVLFSAVSATRRDRLREGVLLKTLGATRRQVGRIMLAEYAILGLLGSLTGVLLSLAAAWALSRFVFETTFVPAVVPALLVSAAMTLLAVAIGVMTGREVFRSTPMVALREA
nr:FtsX-like permease family protein [Gemmatimonadaceae bacterium]